MAAKSEKQAQAFQVRLAPQEDSGAEKLASERKLSKNDVLRRALNLLLRLENETQAGARLLIERPGRKEPEPVEVWLL